MATKLFVHDGSVREVGRIYASDGTQRTIKVGFVHDGTAQRVFYRYGVHRGTITIATVTGGGGDSWHGYQSGLMGSHANLFGATITGFYTYTDGGSTTYLEMPQHLGFTTVRATVDNGTTWTSLGYVGSGVPGPLGTGYAIVGDPLGLNSIVDTTVVTLHVQFMA